MPNVMAAADLPNIDGAFCESSVIPFLVPRRKVWLTADGAVEGGRMEGEREGEKGREGELSLIHI